MELLLSPSEGGLCGHYTKAQFFIVPHAHAINAINLKYTMPLILKLCNSALTKQWFTTNTYFYYNVILT